MCQSVPGHVFHLVVEPFVVVDAGDVVVGLFGDGWEPGDVGASKLRLSLQLAVLFLQLLVLLLEHQQIVQEGLFFLLLLFEQFLELSDSLGLVVAAELLVALVRGKCTWLWGLFESDQLEGVLSDVLALL